MAEHRIRYASKADFEGVMAFGDVYLGIDYLRHTFHGFMEDPNAKSYVYTIGEEIVGFCTAFLVDDGKTLLIRGSRVKGGHQGQGIYGKLTKHVYEEYKGIPSLKYEAFTTNNLNYESKKEGLQRSYNVISEKAFLNYRFKVEDINIPVPKSDANVQEVTSAEMTTIFSAVEVHEDLFPGGKIIIDWVPLRLLISNMKYIFRTNALALQSKSDNSQVSLLTIGVPVPCELGLRYSMDVFGSDVTMLRHHILYHLGHLKKLTDKMVVFQVIIEQPLEKSADDIVKNLGVSDFDFKMNGLINFERDFK